MKDDMRQRLDKAARAIHAGKILLQGGEPAFAVSRAYYAMFYVAEALLWQEGLRSRTHGGVHSLFGERFAKTGRLDPKYHRRMLDAFDRRIEDDYGFDLAPALENPGEVIEQAAEFLQSAEAFLSGSSIT